jgi:hypothetical protein
MVYVEENRLLHQLIANPVISTGIGVKLRLEILAPLLIREKMTEKTSGLKS